ncbi:hypothetical protein [Actinoplanes sp. URMC 104]|uniref:hypothetical protein n=1 Tax=Actinoplanes sp. URMC 104 TaxID=3423409 RepID=UPI003F1A68BD
MTTTPRAAKRRWVLIAVVGAWIVVVAALAVWSVGHERPTVPEQRDIGLAVADLQRATGAVFAAASGDGRTVALEELQWERDCKLTPVRSGLGAARSVVVYVPVGEATAAVESIAAALPAGYRADAGTSHGGTQVSLHADAGNFVGVDLSEDATTQELTFRVSTGCRPRAGDGTPDVRDPPVPAAPRLLADVVRAVGGNAEPARTWAVTCPDGTVGVSYAVDLRPGERKLREAVRAVAGRSKLVPISDGWTWRAGDDAVTVLPGRVTVSRGCQ